MVPITDFLFGTHWSPQIPIREDQVGSSGAFGAIPLFTGTFLIAFIAMIIAGPIGLMSAIYMSEYATKKTRDIIKPLTEILAGIPTVVYGFFAVIVVAPFIRSSGEYFGLNIASESALAAGLVMGIMIIPFVSSISDDVINAVPQNLKDGSLGVGATKSETIVKVIIPAALPGIIGGLLLAISRAVRRKNIPSLVEAYGRSEKLKRKTNLILILGCRDNTSKLDPQQKDVFQKIFEMIDKYNLYGKVAYPKKHTPVDIPAFYRWAASRAGLFVNPALTEPFGLTLLEASSCGLPIVSTDDGGPKEIYSKCDNGLLVNVTDINKLRTALEKGISNSPQWKSWSKNGIEGVHRHFSWSTHVRNYLSILADENKKFNVVSHPLVSSKVA